MYNLLISSNGWPNGVGTLPSDRLLARGYTEEGLTARFRPAGAYAFDELMRLPCLFMEEGRRDEIARLGRLHHVRRDGNIFRLEYTMEQGFPEFRNSDIFGHRAEFGIEQFEFGHSHWAVKDVDLFRSLLRLERPERSLPTVFRINRAEEINERQISVMMPFDAGSRATYEAIQAMAARNHLVCNRADDIWAHEHIMQDVVSLIDRSKIVICDLTGRNANVFYEAGIAHTLGRNVILITQNAADVPFDLQGIRYIRYHGNPQGVAVMVTELEQRIHTIYAGA